MKMASAAIYDPNVNPMTVLEVIKSIGVECLGWKPEVLFSHIDKTYGGWSPDKVAGALLKFHETGLVQTDLPTIVRHKIYAIRVILTSDTAHREWNVFEKVGSAFNGRQAHFGIIEPLSSIECAKTIALIDAIRPDEFSNEIKIYVAASCHQDGLYTTSPSKYLKMSDPALQSMNQEQTGRPTNDKIVSDITLRMQTIAQHNGEVSDFVGLQAAKLLACDYAADEIVKNS